MPVIEIFGPRTVVIFSLHSAIIYSLIHRRFTDDRRTNKKLNNLTQQFGNEREREFANVVKTGY